jgi:hypothetical protein
MINIRTNFSKNRFVNHLLQFWKNLTLYQIIKSILIETYNSKGIANLVIPKNGGMHGSVK